MNEWSYNTIFLPRNLGLVLKKALPRAQAHAGGLIESKPFLTASLAAHCLVPLFGQSGLEVAPRFRFPLHTYIIHNVHQKDTHTHTTHMYL